MRRGSLVASRLLGRVVDPVPSVVSLVRGARRPEEAAQRAVTAIDGITPPTPADVVGAYLRGRVLFGIPEGTDVRFRYHWDPERGVIDEQTKRIPKRIRTIEQRLGFEVGFDEEFAAVLEASRREDYTWITDEIRDLYLQLFDLGFASSIAVYQGGELVGGLWGIQVGRGFGLMSVFHRVDHAGSMAMIAMVEQLGAERRWDLVDVGLLKPSFERFGARAVPAQELTSRLLRALGRAAPPLPA